MHLSSFTSTILTSGSLAAATVIKPRDEWQPTEVCMYLTSGFEWQGKSQDLCAVPSYCCKYPLLMRTYASPPLTYSTDNSLPDSLTTDAGGVSSAGPDDGLTCFLYSGESCTGVQSAPISNPGIANLTDINFDNTAKSFRCYSWCGYMGPSSSISSSVASSTSETLSSTSKAPSSTSKTTSSTSKKPSSTSIVLVTTTVGPSSATSTTAAGITTTIIDTSVSPDQSATLPTTAVMTHTFADGGTVLTTLAFGTTWSNATTA